MPHQHGADLGGIRTLEDLRVRCVMDEETGCWHWRMSMSQGRPRVHIMHPVSHEGVNMRGRRAALVLATGQDLPPLHFAFARLCCTSDDCCNPDHARSGNREAHGEWLRKSGKVKGLPSKMAASRRTWDKRGRKITAAMRQEILHSNESQISLARKFGVSNFVIWQVRQGLTHRKLAAGASVFVWRP